MVAKNKRTFGQRVSDFFEQKRDTIFIIVAVIIALILIAILFRKKMKAQIRAAKEENERRIQKKEDEKNRRFLKKELGVKVKSDTKVNIIFVEDIEDQPVSAQQRPMTADSVDSYINPYSIPPPEKDNKHVTKGKGKKPESLKNESISNLKEERSTSFNPAVIMRDLYHGYKKSTTKLESEKDSHTSSVAK